MEMKKILFLEICFLPISCTKKDEKPPVISKSEPVQVESIGDTVCETKCGEFDQKICDGLFHEYDRCSSKKDESACSGFVASFSKALPRTVVCTNTCSKTPFKMPISYRCDEVDKSGYPKVTERSSHLLSKLKFEAAINLFLSDEFYGILDGALAEDIKPEIKEAKKRRQGK